jgi:hypothetical protein
VLPPKGERLAKWFRYSRRYANSDITIFCGSLREFFVRSSDIARVRIKVCGSRERHDLKKA